MWSFLGYSWWPRSRDAAVSEMSPSGCAVRMVRKALRMDLSEQVDVVDNPEKGYYEVRVAGRTAGAMVYQRIGSRRVIQAASIGQAFRGRGLAQALMSRGLDDIRSQGETISSVCPILDRFLVANPQYQDLVDPAHPLRALRGIDSSEEPRSM